MTSELLKSPKPVYLHSLEEREDGLHEIVFTNGDGNRETFVGGIHAHGRIYSIDGDDHFEIFFERTRPRNP